MVKRVDSSDSIQKEKNESIKDIHDPKAIMALIYKFAKKFIGQIPANEYQQLMQGLDKLQQKGAVTHSLSEAELDQLLQEFGDMYKAGFFKEALEVGADIDEMNQLIDDAMAYTKKNLLQQPMTQQERGFVEQLPKRITEQVVKKPNLTKIATSLAQVQASVFNEMSAFYNERDAFQAQRSIQLSQEQKNALSDFVNNLRAQQEEQKKIEENQKKQKVLGFITKLFGAIVNAITKLPNVVLAAATFALSCPTNLEGQTLADKFKGQIMALLDKTNLPESVKELIAAVVVTVVIMAVTGPFSSGGLMNTLVSATMMSGFFEAVTDCICDEIAKIPGVTEKDLMIVRATLNVVFTVAQAYILLKTFSSEGAFKSQGMQKLMMGTQVTLDLGSAGLQLGSGVISFQTGFILQDLATFQEKGGDLQALMYQLESLQKAIKEQRSTLNNDLKNICDSFSNLVDMLKKAVKAQYGS